MVDINVAITTLGLDIVKSFAQQYMLDAGLKKFGNKGEQATYNIRKGDIAPLTLLLYLFYNICRFDATLW